MKTLTNRGHLLLVLLGGFSVGCADDRANTTPVDTTGETDPGTTETTSSGTDGSTGTTGTGTTTSEDALVPWYGTWYTIYPATWINTPVSYENGGASFGFTLFDLGAGSATIRVERCLWESLKFEYTTVVDKDGVVVLEPVGGVHEYPHGEIDRIYITPGADCNSMVVTAVGTDGVEADLFSSSGLSLARGELCLEQCAETQGEQGLISDCGTPVPWECGE